jgi:hypothetical protein
MSIPAWEGNWREDMLNAVHELGYASPKQFADSNPTDTYEMLSDRLADVAARAFAAVQIENLLLDSFGHDRTAFAVQSLVRHLRRLMPDGYGVGKDATFNFAHAIGAWGSRLPDELAVDCASIATRISALQPTKGWLPTDANDPILIAAFIESY